MSGRGDQEIEVALERRLARGPADVIDLLQSLRKRRAAVVRGQEGAVHGLIHARLRSGQIVVVGRSARGLALYAPAGAESQPALGDGPAPEPLPASVSKIALRVAKPVRDGADRGRVIADAVAHLTDLESRGARKDFGSPRLARALLHRADRGKWAVFFTASGGDKVRRLAVHEGPWILCAVVLFFVVRAFVGEVFQIPSDSMRPTLEPGDRVVVSKLASDDLPERWSVVVFRHLSRMRGREIAVVKRLVGLPGEEIAIFQGDVFVNGTRLVKPDDVRRALRLPHTRWSAKAGTFIDWDRGPSHDEIGWSLRDYPVSGDVFYNPDVRAVVGRPMALFDGYLRFDVTIPDGSGASVTLARGRLDDPAAPGALEWTLSVENGTTTVVERRVGGTSATLVSVPVGPVPGRVALELAYVDGVLRASFETEGGGWSWSEARSAPYHPLALRVGVRDAATPHAVGLDQDVHYSHDHHHAVPSAEDLVVGRMNPHRIPPEHVFFLGDNTRDSTDSRHAETGDIPVAALVGPVTFRIWPPTRIGRIR